MNFHANITEDIADTTMYPFNDTLEVQRDVTGVLNDIIRVQNYTENSTDKSDSTLLYIMVIYVIPLIFVITLILGIIGNGTLILIFIKHRSMRTAPNSFLFSLAVADLLVILIYVPISIVIYTQSTYPGSELICQLSDFMKDFSNGLSVFTLMVLSAERYFAVVDVFKPSKFHNVRFVYASLFCIWLAALFFASPAFVFTTLEKDSDDFQYCRSVNLEETSAKYINVTKSAIFYVIPLLFIGVFYSMMARKLLESTKNLPETPDSAQGDMLVRTRKSIACMVLTCAVLFFICFLPHHFYMLWFTFNPNTQASYNALWLILRTVELDLFFMHSCVNPVALYYSKGKTGQYMKHYLFRGKKPVDPPCSSSARLSRTTLCETYKSTTQRCNSCAPCELVLWSTRHLTCDQMILNLFERMKTSGKLENSGREKK